VVIVIINITVLMLAIEYIQLIRKYMHMIGRMQIMVIIEVVEPIIRVGIGY
jgi:hypothetical protein